MFPQEKEKPPNAHEIPTDQTSKSSTEGGGKIQSPTRTSETFLFEQQLDSNAVERRRIKIPWEKAETYFPPHTQEHSSIPIVVSDTRNTNWPMAVTNYPLSREYAIEVGWPGFATAHNLEAMDRMRFYTPLHPSHQYHYLIKCEKPQKESTETNVKIDGFDVEYLFEKELTLADVTQRNMRIPTEEAERHFPRLERKPDGTYKDDGINVSDPRGGRRWFKIRFSEFLAGYVIAGDKWSDFVAKHDLHQKDVIRFFKVVTDVADDKYYYVDYVRAKEAAKTKKRSRGE